MRSFDVQKLMTGLAAAALSLLAGACEDDASESLPSTLAECGSNLDVLLARPADGAPRLDASYSDALAEWSFPDGFCGLGVFSGVCADGKRLLYRNGGFTSETRYFDGEQLVGYVGTGDVGSCPSVCPFSRFYGTPDSVRCAAPALEPLCDGFVSAEEASSWLPFANGQPPGGCESL